MTNFDPPEAPIQFVNDNEICEHGNYEENCKECKEDHNLEKFENDRKS